MPSGFENALLIWSANPFAISESSKREQWRMKVLRGPIASELRKRIRRADRIGAKQLVLAVGQAQACAPSLTPQEVLSSTIIPSPLMRELPRKRQDYLRIVLAAGRAYHALTKIRGSSPPMAELKKKVWAACFGESLLHTLELEKVIRDHDVLILGETGTGKEGVAEVFLQAAPGLSNGSAAPRSALNAAAIPETLVESELFGHAKGAFTGATEARLGRLRAAAGGSFFLDEVGDLPSTTQVKLLRVIETNEIYPLGTDTPFQADLRYIAATHKDLDKMVETGHFRRDLLSRLAGIRLTIPPLRDRPQDIQEIGQSFIESYINIENNPQSANDILAWLQSSEARNHSWPGNVRELQNVLRNVMLGLPPGLQGSNLDGNKSSEMPATIAQNSATLKQVQDWYIRRTLKRHNHNLTRAART